MANILVVEDEINIARGLKTDLDLEGHAVEIATDGETGLKRALSDQFKLIILDVMLPKMNGIAVCKALRKNKIATPILMLTAKSSESDMVVGLESGADDYVKKPFSSLELLARVGALLRRTEGREAQSYHFGEIEVDFTRVEVRSLGKPIEITPLEFKILAVFIRKRGQVLTRAQLLDEVWGSESDPNDRAVDQHIMHLRQKIGANYLTSIRTVGYRFEG
jgi:two-component system alkaline phosphatase synthesis response regulator PhoP